MSYLITGLVGSVDRTSNARRDSEPLIVESTARSMCLDLSRFLGAVNIKKDLILFFVLMSKLERRSQSLSSNPMCLNGIDTNGINIMAVLFPYNS